MQRHRRRVGLAPPRPPARSASTKHTKNKTRRARRGGPQASPSPPTEFVISPTLGPSGGDAGDGWNLCPAPRSREHTCVVCAAATPHGAARFGPMRRHRRLLSRLLHPQSAGARVASRRTAALPPRSGAWFRHASTLRTCESPYVLTNGRHPPCSSSPPLPTGDSVAALQGPGAFGASSPSSKLHSPPPESSSVSAHTYVVDTPISVHAYVVDTPSSGREDGIAQRVQSTA